MKLTTGRYLTIVSIQTFLLTADWLINIFSLLTRQNNALMLILFIIQLAFLIAAIAVLLLTFFSTYVFQTGLVYLLYERFRSTLIVCTIYFILTAVINIWLLALRWNNLRHTWTTAFLIFFILHRFMSAVYYYHYKRAALRISDPRFYEDIDWEETSKISVGNGHVVQ